MISVEDFRKELMLAAENDGDAYRIKSGVIAVNNAFKDCVARNNDHLLYCYHEVALGMMNELDKEWRKNNV